MNDGFKASPLPGACPPPSRVPLSSLVLIVVSIISQLVIISPAGEVVYGAGGGSPYSDANTHGADYWLEYDPGSDEEGPGPLGGASAALRLQLLDGITPATTIECADCHRASSGEGAGVADLRASYNSTLDDGHGRPPFTSYDAENFALCFKCHDEDAFTCQPYTDECGWGDGMKTNFYSVPYDINLHAVHVAGKPGFALKGSFTACANCHYDVHSNQVAPNTMKSTANGFWNRPAGAGSGRVSFSPLVGPNTRDNYGSPVWGCAKWFSWRKGCNYNCHGFDQELFYTPPDIAAGCNLR
jgi:hypothetical protein